MSKIQFKVARQYIEDGNYDKAREILRTLEHPSAQKWLDKLDDLDPPFPDVPIPQYTTKSRQSQAKPESRLTSGEVRYIKHQTEMYRIGRIMSLSILGCFATCSILPLVIMVIISIVSGQAIRIESPSAFITPLIMFGFIAVLFIYVKNMDF